MGIILYTDLLMIFADGNTTHLCIGLPLSNVVQIQNCNVQAGQIPTMTITLHTDCSDSSYCW